MNLSIWEERTQEEENREAVPVLCFNQHGPRVKGKFLIPNMALWEKEKKQSDFED